MLTDRLRRATAPVRHPAQAVRAPGGRDPSRRPAPCWARLAADELPAQVDPRILVSGRWLATGGIALLLLGAGGPAVAVLGGTVVLLAPRAAIGPLRRRRVLRRDAQLAEALERVAAAVRAGHALGPALGLVADGLREPLGAELREVTGVVRHGGGLTDALDRWADGPDSSGEVVLAAAALTLGAGAGGQVARALDNVAATLRERRQLQAEVRALATQARASAWLLALAPLGFAGLMTTVEPEAVGFLVGSPIGLACLGLGVGLDALGLLWMARIVGRAA